MVRNQARVLSFSYVIVLLVDAWLGYASAGPYPQNFQTFVVGGQEASINQFPYQASVRHNGQHICGAVVISPNYVVTAGHCLDGYVATRPPSQYNIRVGSKLKNSGGVVINAAELKLHPQYAFPEFDVALIRLAYPLTYSSSIQPVEIASENLISGATLVASGWGYTSTNGLSPNELRWVSMKAITNAECSQRLYDLKYTTQCLVAPEGQGICQGDSGGPAVRNNKLYGVVSFTVGSCGSSIPDGFTKLPLMRSWIISNSDLGNVLKRRAANQRQPRRWYN